MKQALIILAIPAVALAAFPGWASLVDHVDPFIGTGGHGHTFPGPTLPFGMVQLSPDTRLEGWDGCSVYHYSDTAVFGFSHTHLSGTGVGDYGDILLMPVTGEPLLENGYPDHVDEGYGSRFRKETEKAEAGWYAVHLDDYDVAVELTATPRTGLHRYVFPAGKPAHVIIDLTHRDELLDVDLTVPDDRTVAGFRRSAAWARDQMVHFRAAFSRPFTASEIITDDIGRPIKAVLSFGDKGGDLLVQVGISAVDDAGARGNLEAEWADFDFPATRARARAAWSAALDRFEVAGADDADLTVLATALYHSFIAPNLFSDADARYRGMDFQTHTAEDRDHSTVFSLWDTYRATHPLFTLVERDRTRDFVATMLAQYDQGGRLPVWELAANETDCMIGYHSVSVIADAYLKGIVTGGEDHALDAMIDSAKRDHFGLDAYKRDGFISADLESESVSKTLEYAYDDLCIARMAAMTGRMDEFDTFSRRSLAWRHLYDPATGCFRPRINGQWLKPYDPRRVDNHHTEANGWQYRFAAPHDLQAHIQVCGGDGPFLAALDSLFTVESATTGRDQPDITGRIGQYAHGNEPSHHVAWLYHGAGRPQKSADRIGYILDEFYTPRPDGLIGNEDCGQMSSWYVLAAYGLYDIAPSSRQWLIIPPLHEHMSMRFEDGAVFTTRREGTGAVESVTWNGKPLSRSFLWHHEVTEGGELVFHLGREGDWGKALENRPPSSTRLGDIIPAPWADAPDQRFRGRMKVALGVDDPRAEIRWTDDPQVDPHLGNVYDKPITIAATTTLRFVARKHPLEPSPVVAATFTALPEDWSVTLGAEPNPQYTAGGPDALIDGVRGPEDWRRGGWHGYEGKDFSLTLDLGEARPVARAGASFLQDVRSWIVMPQELLVETSRDGRTFSPAGRVGHDVAVEDYGVILRDLTVELDGAPVRALRFTAIGSGPMPPWHPGAGGASFIFVDELIVE